MTGRGWAIGSDIISKPLLDEQTRDEFDRIFKKGKYAVKPENPKEDKQQEDK